ncbi:WD40 repeat domain-containing protein [Sorangium sp. So ce131]|uniref:WD40 repeat domain-containing protein n=1 Tax=Sorangium sp. So ce131 TaxID=3133282 RepID=UPI003F61ADE6
MKRLAALAVLTLALAACDRSPRTTVDPPAPSLPIVHEDLTALAFTPDGATLVTLGPGEVRRFDLHGRQLGAAALPRHAGGTVTLSPDGRRVATLHHELPTASVFEIHDAASGRVVATVKESLTALVLPSTLVLPPRPGVLIAIGEPYGTRVFDLAAGRQTDVLYGRAVSGGPVAFSADGRCAAAGRDVVSAWDTATGATIGAIEPPAFLDRGHRPAPVETHASAERIALSPDCSAAAVAYTPYGMSPSLRVRRFATGAEWTLPRGTSSGAVQVALPDPETVVTAHGEQPIQVFDAATGHLRRSFGRGASAMAIAPDGKTLAAASSGRVRLWDLTTGAQLSPP